MTADLVSYIRATVIQIFYHWIDRSSSAIPKSVAKNMVMTMIKNESEESLALALKEAQTEINNLADNIARDWLHAKLQRPDKAVVAIPKNHPITEVLGLVDD